MESKLSPSPLRFLSVLPVFSSLLSVTLFLASAVSGVTCKVALGRVNQSNHFGQCRSSSKQDYKQLEIKTFFTSGIESAVDDGDEPFHILY